MNNNQLFADVSSNNSFYNAASYASAGHIAISVKATEGAGYVNPDYMGPNATWVRDSHQHDLSVFHYHFGRPENGNPRGEAEHFWNHVQPHFRRPGDYTVLDLETGSPSQGATWAREFDRHLREISGTRPIIYTYLSYFYSGGVTAASNKIWLAAYGNRQPSLSLGNGQRLWAWQYTDGAGYGPGPQSFAGIGRSDGSILNIDTVKELVKAHGHR